MRSRRNKLWRLRHSVGLINRAAFTLVELLVVVVIAVILLAVTLPTVKYSLEEGKLREGTRQINAFFASARAQAASTGRPAGVWLELTQIGDPTAALGLFQCSQLYMAEVPAPYSGDILNAVAIVSVPPIAQRPIPPNPAPNPPDRELQPWLILFPGSPGAYSLFKINEPFSIRFDFKGTLYHGITQNITNTDDDGDGSTDETGEFGFWLHGRGGADYEYGRKGVDDNGNGIVDRDFTGVPDLGEFGRPGTDDVLSVCPTSDTSGYAFQLYRPPQRAGQPFELPQGIVIDMPYSGIGPSGGASLPVLAQLDGDDLTLAKTAVIVMFSPSGGVASVAYIKQTDGTLVEDVGTSGIFLLVGKTEKVYYAWDPATIADSNIADGSNMWIAVNRRTGSVATVENTPSFNPADYSPQQNFPPANDQQRQKFLTRAREFARTGEVKGGQ